MIDGARAYALDAQVALRPEPFGALAYHYGNRRLSFLRAPELVALVRDLEHHPSLDAALAASGIEERRWPSFRKALGALADSEMICARTDEPKASAGPERPAGEAARAESWA